MNNIQSYLNTMTVDQIRKVRKRMYRTIMFTRNKHYANLLGALDAEMMYYLVSRSQQSDTDCTD